VANHFFQFKQFTVHQEHCAMKVCTDACLFGAWAVNRIKNSASKIKNCLDIGTGTGLLSLMLAQKCNAIIDSVEIDDAAAQQAGENFEASPWKERITLHYGPVQQFNPSIHPPYNFIISNPPFFENDLKSDDSKRNIALHSEALSLKELLESIQVLLQKEGKFAVLLPYHRSASFEQLAGSKGFYLEEKVAVKQTPEYNYFRSMLYFGYTSFITEEKEMVIQTKKGGYTKDFVGLLKDYYLHL